MSYDELTAKLLRKTEQQAARIERLEADTLRLYRIGMEGLQDFAAQRKEVKRLRAALWEIASHNADPRFFGAAHKIASATVGIARAALEERT